MRRRTIGGERNEARGEAESNSEAYRSVLATDLSPTPDLYADVSDGDEPPHGSSTTGYTMDAMRMGAFPMAPCCDEVPGDDDALRAGDPDVDPLENELSGDEIPGGTMPSPDQCQVDAIGRAYGVEDMDGRELHLGEEQVGSRDDRRYELHPRPKRGRRP